MRRRSRKAGALIFSGQIRSGNIAGSPRIGISSGARPSVSNRFSVSVISTASSVCAACPATRYPGTESFGLRDYQISAVEKLEKSFREERPRALVQMATGSGKTFTAITSVYRLLKYADAKRILFLVDTKNLGEQAEQEFMSYLPNDDNRKFTELYITSAAGATSSPAADAASTSISPAPRRTLTCSRRNSLTSIS
jgi:hypothetical protein